MDEESISTELLLALNSRDFIDSMGVGLVLQDAAGVIVDSNVAAAQLLGLTLDQMMGRTSFDPSWGAVHEDGSTFAGEDHPAMVSLRRGEICRSVVMGVDNAQRARRWILIDAWPIISDGVVRGVITTFDDQTERVVRDKTFHALARINELIVQSHEASAFLAGAAASLVVSLGYACVAFVADTPEGVAELAVATAPDLEGAGCGALEAEGPVVGALSAREVRVENDLAGLSHSWAASDVERGYRSVIALPLVLHSRAAALVLYGRRSFDFDDVTTQGLAEIARVIEVGAEHVEALTHLARAFDGTLGALAQVVETRDPYTAGHQSNVGALSEAIALRLGLAADLVGQIRRAAEVHDIGKMTVPAEILTKPGRLDPLEYELVQTHPRVGAQILARASLGWPIAEVALQHHERLDGSGYPEGLRGEQIIVPARIVAVADVFEAMVQHRPYRPGLGVEAAMGELLEGAGLLYDAGAVRALVEVIEAGFRFEGPLVEGTTLERAD